MLVARCLRRHKTTPPPQRRTHRAARRIGIDYVWRQLDGSQQISNHSACRARPCAPAGRQWRNPSAAHRAVYDSRTRDPTLMPTRALARVLDRALRIIGPTSIASPTALTYRCTTPESPLIRAHATFVECTRSATWSYSASRAEIVTRPSPQSPTHFSVTRAWGRYSFSAGERRHSSQLVDVPLHCAAKEWETRESAAKAVRNARR